MKRKNKNVRRSQVKKEPTKPADAQSDSELPPDISGETAESTENLVEVNAGEELTDTVADSLEDETADSIGQLQEPITGHMTGVQRNSTFKKAESYFSKSKLDLALQCYLNCIKGIERGSGFLYLPQCLHQIAECYHLKDEDAKAIQFLKAEKIYYETALIDTQQMQDKIDVLGTEEDKTADEDAALLRAVEYENLAKLCLEKHQSQLALEFSGKATKLYQQHYGDEHASTQRCLDLFTSVYAQVGKEEYKDKLNEYETGSEPSSQLDDGTQANMRRRKKSTEGKEKEQTTTDTREDTQAGVVERSEMVEREMSGCCLAFLWILLVICALSAAFLFAVVYCKVTPTSWTCHWVRVQYRSLAEHLGFLVYKMNKKG